ncbi:MAG: N-formylglutamate amidohydrolase [Rhodopseudomonas palustris]|nr:MAG: N-formylglutamate amidohydrolase [Rhodopseudomonas palustris]
MSLMSETSDNLVRPMPLQLDPVLPPVIERNAASRSPFLLVCDHYGRLIPALLDNLGLPDSELQRHIAFDIGIGGVAERLSELLDAQLIAQRYSRLVIDCNRPPQVASSIPVLSEATEVPGNLNLSPQQAEARRKLIFEPYHQRISAAIEQRLAVSQSTVLVALHSFTPVYAGVARPWHVGALYHRDTVLPPLLLDQLRADGTLVVGDNQPYGVSDLTDYTIPVHGEARGLISTGIEIRQDQIADPDGQQRWAERLAQAFAEIADRLRAAKLIG